MYWASQIQVVGSSAGAREPKMLRTAVSNTPHRRRITQKVKARADVLANQEDIHCAEIELVEERESRETFFSRVHAGIKL